MMAEKIVSLLCTVLFALSGCDTAKNQSATDLVEDPTDKYEETTDDVDSFELSDKYYEEYGLYFDSSTGTIMYADRSITGDFVIPSEIDGAKVTSIGDSHFTIFITISKQLPFRRA